VLADYVPKPMLSHIILRHHVIHERLVVYIILVGLIIRRDRAHRIMLFLLDVTDSILSVRGVALTLEASCDIYKAVLGKEVSYPLSMNEAGIIPKISIETVLNL
jgi:hypothetical protein